MKTYDVALPKAKRGLGDIDYRRRLAQQLMSQGTDTSPVGHWTQAAARIAQAISGSLNQDQAESQDAALQADANAALMQMLPSMTGGSSSAGAPPQSAVAAASQPVQPLSDEELGVAKFASPGLAQSVPKVASALAPQDMRGAPAAIRHNNPGAMWPGPSSKKFGATGFQVIGGGNKIATFPDATSGAAAQFDLLSRSYAGMPLDSAIKKWSGGNSSPQYVAKIAQSLGVAPNTVLTPQMLQDPAVAVPLAKTMAQWESGKPFPLDDQKWNEAHKMALGGPTQAETAAAQPQQMQVADASGDRANIERLLSNPYTRDMALKLIQQQQRKPATALDQANIDYKRAQTEALRAKQDGGDKVRNQRLQMLQDMKIDPNSAEGKAVLINGKLPASAYVQLNQQQLRQKAAPKIGEGLNNLRKMTDMYDDASFENSVGPFQGATPDGLFSAAPINAARLMGEAWNWWDGGKSAPSEVRSNIQGSTEALAAAIKPLIRAPGEGVWTDQDQARLVSVVGDLAQARDKDEFKRRLEAVRERVKANFDLDIKTPQADGWQDMGNGVRIREKR